MNDLLKNIADLKLNIDSASAVQIAEIWKQVQLAKVYTLSAVLVVIFIVFICIVIRCES